MKVTFILKDLSDFFYNGGTFAGENIKGLFNLTDKEKFDLLNKKAHEYMGALNITQKIGNNSFRDKVELNSILKKNNVSFSFKLEPRRGYKLATFEIN